MEMSGAYGYFAAQRIDLLSAARSSIIMPVESHPNVAVESGGREVTLSEA